MHGFSKIKDSIKDMRSDVTDDIWSLTNKAEMLKEDRWVADVDDRMRRFELDLIATMK